MMSQARKVMPRQQHIMLDDLLDFNVYIEHESDQDDDDDEG